MKIAVKKVSDVDVAMFGPELVSRIAHSKLHITADKFL